VCFCLSLAGEVGKREREKDGRRGRKYVREEKKDRESKIESLRER